MLLLAEATSRSHTAGYWVRTINDAEINKLTSQKNGLKIFWSTFYFSHSSEKAFISQDQSPIIVLILGIERVHRSSCSLVLTTNKICFWRLALVQESTCSSWCVFQFSQNLMNNCSTNEKTPRHKNAKVHDMAHKRTSGGHGPWNMKSFLPSYKGNANCGLLSKTANFTNIPFSLQSFEFL